SDRGSRPGHIRRVACFCPPRAGTFPPKICRNNTPGFRCLVQEEELLRISSGVIRVTPLRKATRGLSVNCRHSCSRASQTYHAPIVSHGEGLTAACPRPHPPRPP